MLRVGVAEGTIVDRLVFTALEFNAFVFNFFALAVSAGSAVFFAEAGCMNRLATTFTFAFGVTRPTLLLLSEAVELLSEMFAVTALRGEGPGDGAVRFNLLAEPGAVRVRGEATGDGATIDTLFAERPRGVESRSLNSGSFMNAVNCVSSSLSSPCAGAVRVGGLMRVTDTETLSVVGRLAAPVAAAVVAGFFAELVKADTAVIVRMDSGFFSTVLVLVLTERLSVVEERSGVALYTS